MKIDALKHAAFIVELGTNITNTVVNQIWYRFNDPEERAIALNNFMANMIILITQKISKPEHHNENIQQVIESLNDYISGKNLIYVKHDRNTNEITKEELH